MIFVNGVLIPLKCPVCGGPVDRGLTRCEYCETSFFQPASKIEEGPDMPTNDVEQMLNAGIITANEARKNFIDDAWICHYNEKPEANKKCWVRIEPAPFIGLDSQTWLATYNPFDDVYVDVIEGLRLLVDSPVCTYWKYVR